MPIVPVEMPSQPQAPTFVSKLQQKEIFESMPVTLECHVTSNPEATITWFKVQWVPQNTIIHMHTYLALI
jgi:hypothetical protein